MEPNLFDKFDDEYLCFERIENPRHRRPDVCAFLMLDELFPGDCDMVSAAGYEEIYLDISGDQLRSLDDDTLRDLHRCGVRFDSFTESAAMFV